MEIICSPTPAHNDYKRCAQSLKFGTTVVKYNFKNNKSKAVILSISTDENKLMYQDLEETNKIFSGTTSLKITKFVDIVYGKFTDNIIKHQKLADFNNPNDAQSARTSQSVYEKEDIWYPWKCVSLVKANGTTLDFTITDESMIISFLHFFHQKIHKPTESTFLKQYKWQKIKMKLDFEGTYKQLTMSHMFQLAIFCTLIQKQRIAAIEIKKSLKNDRDAYHRIFYPLVDPITSKRRDPTFDEQVDRLSNLIQHTTMAIQRERRIKATMQAIKGPQRKSMQVSSSQLDRKEKI